MSENTYRTQNPATGEVMEEFAQHTAQEVEQAITRADEATGAWAAQSVEDRAAALQKVADLYGEREDELAHPLAG